MNEYLSKKWRDDLLDTDHIKRKYLALPFCEINSTPNQRLDLYLPEQGEGPFPLIINVSGGGWFFGKCSTVHMGSLLFTGLEEGFAVASMACTSSEKQIFPYQIHEVKAAIRYLRKNADKYGLDPQRFILWSASSGGHLSLMTALTSGIEEFDTPKFGHAGISADVQSVVATYAICELGVSGEQFAALGITPQYHTEGPECNEALLMGADLRTIPEKARNASPIHHIRPDAPPVYLQHGSLDRIVPVTQAYQFYEKYCSIAGKDKITLDIIDDAGHSDPRFKNEATCLKICNHLKKLLY